MWSHRREELWGGGVFFSPTQGKQEQAWSQTEMVSVYPVLSAVFVSFQTLTWPYDKFWNKVQWLSASMSSWHLLYEVIMKCWNQLHGLTSAKPDSFKNFARAGNLDLSSHFPEKACESLAVWDIFFVELKQKRKVDGSVNVGRFGSLANTGKQSIALLAGAAEHPALKRLCQCLALGAPKRALVRVCCPETQQSCLRCDGQAAASAGLATGKAVSRASSGWF